nr:signal peptidase I [Haloplanus sp. XH21]
MGILLLAAVFVAPPSSPVNVSYVYSDSMEPTIHTNDGYILVPAANVQQGDIITFRMDERGGYTTHRVVGETERGYITKGDNNPTTDQASGYSYVQSAEIAGKALQYNDDPVTIPNFGIAVKILQQYRVTLLLAIGALVALMGRQAARTSQYVRDVQYVRDLVFPVVLVSILLMIAFPLVGASTVTQTYVVTHGSTDGPVLLAPGETKTHTIVLNRSHAPLTHAVVSVDGATVERHAQNASTTSLALRVTGPTDIGPKDVHITTHAYPALLPRDVVVALHRGHPVLASSAVAFVVGMPLLTFVVLTIDGRMPLRNRSRPRRTRGDS